MAKPISHADLEHLTDAELVAYARAHMQDEGPTLQIAKSCVAFVYERNRGTVRALCAAKAPRDLVEDLEAAVYERFVKAVYLRQEPMTNPGGLLVVMTQRVIATHYERGPRVTTPLDGLTERGAPDERLDDPEVDQVVDQLLSVLSPKQREVVWLRVYGELSSGEIAERLDTSPGNVDVIFYRAMRKLQDVMES